MDLSSLCCASGQGIFLMISPQGCPFKSKQQGGFVKGRFWRMCPRAGFWGAGISRIIAFFRQGSTAGKDFLEEISVQGTSAKTTLLETALLRIPHSWVFKRQTMNGKIKI